jgi:hypothetical protein
MIFSNVTFALPIHYLNEKDRCILQLMKDISIKSDEEMPDIFDQMWAYFRSPNKYSIFRGKSGPVSVLNAINKDPNIAQLFLSAVQAYLRRQNFDSRLALITEGKVIKEFKYTDTSHAVIELIPRPGIETEFQRVMHAIYQKWQIDPKDGPLKVYLAPFELNTTRANGLFVEDGNFIVLDLKSFSALLRDVKEDRHTFFHEITHGYLAQLLKKKQMSPYYGHVRGYRSRWVIAALNGFDEGVAYNDYYSFSEVLTHKKDVIHASGIEEKLRSLKVLEHLVVSSDFYIGEAISILKAKLPENQPVLWKWGNYRWSIIEVGDKLELNFEILEESFFGQFKPFTQIQIPIVYGVKGMSRDRLIELALDQMAIMRNQFLLDRIFVNEQKKLLLKDSK